MSLWQALTLFLVMLPLAAMPSSSVALVVVRSASSGRMNGACAAVGIVVGDLLFVALALIGMTMLAEWLGALFAFVKYAAAAYLIWLGIGLLTPKPAPARLSSQAVVSSRLADFMAGLFLTLGDVKAILFYASLFPTLVDVARLTVWDMSLIAAITIITVGGVKLAYAWFAAEIVRNLDGRLSGTVPRKLGGLLLIGCGSALIAKA